MSKKGCVQIQIGSKKYTFRDVDISSTSLDSILGTLVRSKRFQSEIDDIINTVDQDVNKIIAKGEQIATNIGDYAIGNATSLNLATLSRINQSTDFSAVSAITNLLNYTDNSFLFSDSTKLSKAYIGTKRDFILLNPSIMESGSSLSQTLAFKYASKESTNKNSPIYRTLSNYVEQILDSNHPFREHLEGVSELTAAKKLLLLAQSDDSELSKNLLRELGGIIKSKTENSINITGTTVVGDKIKSIIGYGNNITVFNNHKYTNSNIIGLLQKVRNYKSATDVSDSQLPDNVPIQFKKFYEDNKTGKYEQLLNDLLNNEDIEVNELFDPSVNKTINNIIDYLYKTPEISMDESYIPKVGSIEVEDDYQVEDKVIYLNESNYVMNSTLKSKDTYVELILDESTSKFATVKSGKPLKILINPKYELTDEQIKEIKAEVSTKTGKNAGKGKKPKWVVLKQKSIPTKSVVKGLSELIEKLNTDGVLVESVHSTVYDDFAIQAVKAANQSGISSYIYPNYYTINRNRGEFLSYLDSELNLSFTKSTINKSFTNEEFQKFTNSENPGLFANLKEMQAGDTVTITNTVSQNKMKMVIDHIYDFKFRPKLNPYTSMYNVYTGGFNKGVVFSLLFDDNKRKTGVLVNITDNNYGFILSEGNTYVEIPKSQINSTYSNHSPLYMSDLRYIGDNVYYNTLSGLVKDDLFVGHNVTEYKKFFEPELREIFEKTIYDTYENFLNEEFGNYNNFQNKKFYVFAHYTPEAISRVEVNAPNYSNINMLEVLANSLKRSGIKVNMFTSDEITSLFGPNLASNKAFIHSGMIILNSDLSTEDSPIHELMHLLLAQYKVSNPAAYSEMLKNIPDLTQFEELKERYRELSPNDYAEEVLVHAVTDYFMGRVQDYGALKVSDLNIKELAFQLFRTDSTDKFRDDSEFMNTLMKTLLLDGNSSLLKDLTIGVNLDKTITENKISNVKSNLIQNNNLKIDCK